MTEQPVRVSRRWLYIPFLIAGVIVFAYYLLWRAGAAEMKKAVLQWVEDQRAIGLTVHHGALSAEGFPFFLRVHVDAPEIAAPGEWRWRGERLSLDALPYQLDKLIFSPDGEQVVSAKGYGEWRVSAKDIRASIARDRTRGWKFSTNVSDGTAHRDEDGATATLKTLVFDLAPDADDTTTLVLSLAANGFDASYEGETYKVSDVQTVMSLSHTDYLAGENPVVAWRGAGGALNVTGLFADVEDAKLSAAGALHLDADNYPAGAVKAEIQNPAGLARALGKAGALGRNEAEAAAAGLALMAVAGGGKIAAPIEFKDGTAQIGGVKIADLPMIKS